MSKADELKAKNENLFERNTILLNENERLEKEKAELKDKLYLREYLLRMLVFWRRKSKKEFNAYFEKAEEQFSDKE